MSAHRAYALADGTWLLVPDDTEEIVIGSQRMNVDDDPTRIDISDVVFDIPEDNFEWEHSPDPKPKRKPKAKKKVRRG